MKMIGYQAISISLGNRRNIKPVLFKKISEVLFIIKNILKPNGMIKNMETVAGCQWNHIQK